MVENKSLWSNILALFDNNPILNLVMIVIALASIGLAVFFYIKSKKVKTPTYIVRTISLVKESIKKIETVQINYGGEKVSNLSITKLAFWNDGKSTINSQDIARIEPIKICIEPEYDILECEILFSKNPSNDFNLTLSEDKKTITVNFDYIDFEEGIVVQICHTGSSNKDICVTGQVKSVKKIVRKENVPFLFVKLNKKPSLNAKTKARKTVSVSKHIFGWMYLLMGLYMFLAIITRIIFKREPTITQTEIELMSKFSFYSVFMIIMSLVVVWLGYGLIKRRIPKGFNIYNEEF